MSVLNETGLLAVDIGNSRVKLGWFFLESVCTSEPKQSELPIAAPRLPQPEEAITASHVDVSGDQFATQVGDWLDQLPVDNLRCCLASVHADVAKVVVGLLSQRLSHKPHFLTAAELPLEVRVDEPEKIGIDRLLCAVAANRLRERNRPAIVVSLGTACTVNLISADGAMEGGAILPGIAMLATALQRGTSALPLLSSEELAPPTDAVGKSTPAAISSGLLWGAVGAVHELIDRMSRSFDTSPQVFITGGEATRLAGKLVGPDGPALHVPNMVLAGIRIAAGKR